jgi:hypothetical protein
MREVWHMSRGTHFIEVPKTTRGHDLLKAMRDSLPEYKGRHIKEMLQVYPEHIVWAVEYEYNVPLTFQNRDRLGTTGS